MSTLPPFPPAWWSQLAGQHQRTHAHLTLPKPASRGRKYQHVVLSPSISQNRKNSWHLQRTAIILWISQRCHRLSPGNHMTRWPAVSSCVKRKGLVCQTLYWSVRGKEKQGIEEKRERKRMREEREGKFKDWEQKAGLLEVPPCLPYMANWIGKLNCPNPNQKQWLHFQIIVSAVSLTSCIAVCLFFFLPFWPQLF